MTIRPDVTCKLRAAPLTYRYFFLFAIVFGGSFLVISIGYGTEFRILKHEVIDVVSVTQERQKFHKPDDRFTINTEGCTISSMDPFAGDIKQFIKYPSSVKQCSFANISLLENNETHIWIVKSNFYYHNISEYGMFNCCYKSFYRPDMIYDINSKYIDDRVRYYDECIYFSDVIEVIDEFVRVTCSSLDGDLYEQFFMFAQKKVFSNDVFNTEPLTNATSYNVILMGIDAVSRLNFHRTMPKTLKFLKNKEAIELLGYNKVGDNTFPNVIPLLLGISEKDLRKTCVPTPRSSFDNCPFIWQWFKELGYYTALGEDSAKLGTFNYLKVGFSGTPTDYYLYTFMHEAENHIGNNKDFNSFLCIGSKYAYQMLLDYIQRLTTVLKSNKLFGFFWEVTMSHDYLNYPMVMDEYYENFLLDLDQSGYLDKTILILLSDHGIRWGEIRNTKQGRLEERLPFVYFLIPPSFRDTYELAYNNLKNNAKKLTTPYDLHELLMDLANLDTIKDVEIFARSTQSYGKNRGISLFLSIPGNRTCKVANIDDHWCTCHIGKKLSTERKDVSVASRYLIKHLNYLLRRRPQCAQLILTEIIDATEMDIADAELIEKSWREITVVVRVAPSDAIFEATLRRDKDWAVSGSVSRLNLYADQSRCVDDYRLKLYCYCQ